MSQRKTIGLALGSGAYRGFAHIGVIRSLERHGFQVDYLSGASIGAWVAAYYALFQELQQLENDLMENTKENLSLLFDLSWRKGLITGDRLLKYFDKKFAGQTFAAVKIPLQIVATDMNSASSYIIKDGPLAAAVRASASVPVVFSPFVIDDHFLVDGGMSNPVPCDVVRNMGAEIVIGVNLYHSNEFADAPDSFSNMAVRGTVILLHNLAVESSKSADLVINTDMSAFSKKSHLAKYFTKDTALEMIKVGELATDEIIPQLRKLSEL
jgi:NTE family protein